MASLAQSDTPERFHARLELTNHHLRLTTGGNDYLVLAAILVLSVSLGKESTGPLSYARFLEQIQAFQRDEAKLYGKPIDPPLTWDDVFRELRAFAERGLVSYNEPFAGHIRITPLIETWDSLPTIRRDHRGNLVRSIL